MPQLASNNPNAFYLHATKKFLKATLTNQRFKQLLTYQEKLGEKSGMEVGWEIQGKLPVGSALTEGVDIPVVNPAISRGTATVKEYGAAIPFSNKLEMLSQVEVKKYFEDTLGQNAAETLDKVAFDEVYSTFKAVATANGATAISVDYDGTIASGNSVLKKEHASLIITEMREANIPLINGSYKAVGRPGALRGLKIELEPVIQNVDSGYKRIIMGSVGSYDGCEFIEQTNVATGNDVYFVGDDFGIELNVLTPEIRTNVELDFGRSKGLAWYAMCAMAKTRDLAVGATSFDGARGIKFVG